jgi:hypothetical protein
MILRFNVILMNWECINIHPCFEINTKVWYLPCHQHQGMLLPCHQHKGMILPMDSLPRIPALPSNKPHLVEGAESVQSLHPRIQKLNGAFHKPPNETDNFYTPQNDYFYSKSPYFALDPRRREIRLLKVSPPTTHAEHQEDNSQWTTSQQLDEPTSKIGPDKFAILWKWSSWG